jgi:sensor histidine kinase YesM
VFTVVFIGTLERLASARAQAEAAQRQAAENQLRLLQSQLEPHMLFNTLANLRVLIGLDPQRAQAMLDRLIGFLRATLAASRQPLHPLAEEFRHTDDYLALMAVRMGPRLQVNLQLPPELATLPLPPLLLQPLVENAIKHGLEPKVEGGRLDVSAHREAGSKGAQLVLQVRDTGVGLGAAASAAAAGSGFGLEQVRTRLRTLYGEAATLTLSPAVDAEGGALVTLVLPISNPDTSGTPAR